MPDTLDAMTVEHFGRQLRAGDLSAVDLTNEILRRIEAEAGRLNAFIHVMADEARRQAAEADRDLAAGRDRGPLHGVPVSVKDIVDIRGIPTTAASRVRDGHVAVSDAPIIANLRQAGAVLIGKTNLDEFAFGTMSRDSAFGPVRNPHDVSRSPGGSSGGSAVSVAAGMVLASIGTDTGGSIRIPAAACGIVGFKPAFGEVSTDGVVPLSRTLDHIGPFARNVGDAWVMYHALLGARLTPPGSDDVFVIGDTALVLDANGEALPGLAPVAKQEGAYVAEVIKARLAGKTHAPPFRYRERGKLATIGRRAAIIAFAGLRLKGWLAWWIWGIAHIYFLISLRNRLIVATQWLWSYVTFERGARLITSMHLNPKRDGHGRRGDDSARPLPRRRAG